jgi:hypothetical protein
VILELGYSAPPKLVPLQEPRPLSHRERELLEFLIEGCDSDELREQVAQAEVVATCSCGCPSIGLRGDGPEVPREAMRGLGDFDHDDHARLTARGLSAGERPVEVALHVSLGRIWEMEVWAGADSDLAFDLPALDTLRTA